MKTSIKTGSFELLLILLVFLVSNLSAFFRVLWKIPSVMWLQSGLLVLLAVIFSWMMVHKGTWQRFINSLKRNWFFFPFLIFAFCSIFWSIQPLSSVLRWIILLSIFYIGGYIGLQYSMKEIITNLAAFSLMMMFLSVIFIIMLPDLSIMNYSPYEGTWQGIYWHKNHLGAIIALSNILFLCKTIEKIPSSKKEALFWGAIYLFSIFVLYKTEAVGGYLSSIFIHGVFILLFIWMKIRSSLRSIHYLVFVFIILIVSVLAVTNLEVIFGLFGRSTSLTGRIPLWSTLFQEYFLKHPMIGYGLNAFWYYPPHVAEMAALIGWSIAPVISDNGFFDILMGTGIMGFALFLIFYIALWLRSIVVLKKAEICQDLLPIIFMSFTFIANISFSLIFETEAYIMLIMSILLFSTGKYTQVRKVIPE